jgi:predicted peptidase
MRLPPLAGVAAILVATGTALSATMAPAAAQRRMGGAGTEPQGRGGRQGINATAARIQQRSYVFTETKKKIEYDVFVSSKVQKGKKNALVIALHGRGAPPQSLLRNLTDAAEAGGYIVAAPMGYSLEGWYGITGPNPAPTDPPNLHALSEQDVMNVLDLMRHDFNVDAQRTYLLGQSMGGAGALYLGVKYHEIWAAVVASAPAAGALSPDSLQRATEVPMMLIQGTADDAVDPAQTRRWAAKMRELNMTSEYVELPGVGHSDAIIVGARRAFAFFDAHVKPAG